MSGYFWSVMAAAFPEMTIDEAFGVAVQRRLRN